MSVAVPAPNAAGQEALVYSPVAAKPDAPKVPQAEASGEQRDQRDKERQAPKDQISERLQSMARLAEKQAQKETVAQSNQQSQPSFAPKERIDTSPLRAGSNHSAALSSLNSNPAPKPKPSSPPPSAPPQASSAQTPRPEPKPVEQPRVEASRPNPPDEPRPTANSDGSPFASALEESQARRARQPSAADLAALPDTLARYDSNGDGRINQTELKQVYRAKDERNSYSGLAQPRHSSEKASFYEEKVAYEEPQKMYQGDEAPLPGEDRGEYAPPLPGTPAAEAQTYELPRQAVKEERQLTPQELRALEREYEQGENLYEEDVPPLYVPPEDRDLYSDEVITEAELSVEEDLLQPRKMFDDEPVDSREASATYRQNSERNNGGSSIIA